MGQNKDLWESIYLKALFEAESRKGQPLEPRDRELLESIKRNPKWRKAWIDARSGAHHSPMVTALRLAASPDNALAGAVPYDSPEVFEQLRGLGIAPQSREEIKSLLLEAKIDQCPGSLRALLALDKTLIEPGDFFDAVDTVWNVTSASCHHPGDKSLHLQKKKERALDLVEFLLPDFSPLSQRVRPDDYPRIRKTMLWMDEESPETAAVLLEKFNRTDPAFAREITATLVARRLEATL